MPGRPRTMINRVDQLEIASFKLADAILNTMPERYRNQVNPNDALGQAWNDAYRASVHLWGLLGDVGSEVRNRAGIEGDGPTDNCRLLRRPSFHRVELPNMDALLAEEPPETA